MGKISNIKILLNQNLNKKIQNPIKNFIFKYKINNIVLLILFLTYISLVKGKSKRIDLYINNCEVSFLIKGKGLKKILSDNFSPRPNSISIDNINMGEIKEYYNFEKANSQVSLIYDNLNSCENMFNGLTSIYQITISFFNVSITSIKSMFKGCSSLNEITFLSFDTSQVTDMSNVFHGCSSLTSLNLNSFVTSGVNFMSYMFCGCSNLENLDLSNFVTSSVENLEYMFDGCSQLSSLNIESFDTNNVKSTFSKIKLSN